MRKTTFLILLFLLSSGSVVSQTVDRSFELNEGWNTIGLDVEPSFSEDIYSQCEFSWYNQQLDDGEDSSEISESGRHYVWTTSGDSWSHPDLLSSSKGYSLYLNETSCKVDLGSFDSDEVIQPKEITLYGGDEKPRWNLVNLQSDSQMYKIWNECGRENGIAFWNSRLRSENVVKSDIPGQDRYRFWINKGNSWKHALVESYSIKPNDGVYVPARRDCTVDLTADFASIDSAELGNNIIGEPQDVTLDIGLSTRHPDLNNNKPTLALIKDGDNVAEKQVTWGSETVKFDWENVWSGEREDKVKLELYLKENREGIYWWDRQNMTLGNVNITRCGSSHAFSSFEDSCIEKNSNIDINSIEESTNWTVKTESNTVHALENVQGSSSEGSHELSVDTGSSGYCGGVYFENTELQGDYSFELNMASFGDGDQGPQTAFITVGDNTESFDIAAGNSETYEASISEDQVVKAGLKDSSGNSNSCGDYYKRTDLTVSINK